MVELPQQSSLHLTIGPQTCDHVIVTSSAVALDRAFRALADPSRREFLVRLTDGPLSVKQLHAPTDLTLAAVVQHVQILEHSGLITTRKAGRVRICTVSNDGLSQVEAWLAERRHTWDARLDRLNDVLGEGSTS